MSKYESLRINPPPKKLMSNLFHGGITVLFFAPVRRYVRFCEKP
jgi:hypothetical protein